MPDVEFQANGATAPGYLATPELRKRPGGGRAAGVVGPRRPHPRGLRPLRGRGLLRAWRPTSTEARRPTSPTRRSRR